MIGSLGDVVFEVSDKKIFSINNAINRSYKSKISEHTAIYGPGMLRYLKYLNILQYMVLVC